MNCSMIPNIQNAGSSLSVYRSSELITRTSIDQCHMHFSQNGTHHTWSQMKYCNSMLVKVFVCKCLCMLLSLYKFYKSQQKCSNGHIETNISGVQFGIPFLFWITLSIIVFLGALSKNAIVSLLPLFPKLKLW